MAAMYIITAGQWYYPSSGVGNWVRVFPADDRTVAQEAWDKWLADVLAAEAALQGVAHDWAKLIEIEPDGSYSVLRAWDEAGDG
jgi:hypothetical protein